MKRIKENDIKEILKEFSGKKLEIKVNGAIKQKNIMEKSEIAFLNNGKSIKIFSERSEFTINLSYVEEILLVQKNKLKFLIENQLEILIIFNDI